MDNWLEKYRSIVSSQARYDDDELSALLARVRSDDDLARRQVLGSHLLLALSIAESKWSDASGVMLIDLVQDANSALEDALHEFAEGRMAGGFSEYSRRKVEHAVSLALNRPYR